MVVDIKKPTIVVIDFGKSCFFYAEKTLLTSNPHYIFTGCNDTTPDLLDVFCLGSIMRECITQAIAILINGDTSDNDCLVLIHDTFKPYFNLANQCRLPAENRISIKKIFG